jgi:hypothetical protein
MAALLDSPTQTALLDDLHSTGSRSSKRVVSIRSDVDVDVYSIEQWSGDAHLLAADHAHRADALVELVTIYTCRSPSRRGFRSIVPQAIEDSKPADAETHHQETDRGWIVREAHRSLTTRLEDAKGGTLSDTFAFQPLC